jgi:dTDP-4-amino-4,6-dideoxygalactose transaminase
MDAVLTAMVEEKIGPGDRGRLLIQTAKEYLSFDFALALRSPAVALHLALKALNVKAGQAVVISALSPCYYFQVLDDLMLTPIFCDVTYDFPCMNRELIENAVSKKPEGLEVCAIVLHHTLGFLPDTAAIAEIGIPVIDDISQSYGSVFASHGVFCILGLEERDMLTSGGGAILFAMNKKDALVLRNFNGIANEYCLPDINAALAVVQFKEMQRNIERRRDIAEMYNHASLSLASRTKHKRFIPVNEYNNYSFSLVLETGLKDVVAYAKKKEIEIENAFENTIAGNQLCGDCPVSSSLALRTVLFPMYPMLRSKDVERISRLIMTLP